MDAFFASVEQRDDPTLRGRPVAVGGSSRRGVVAAASYEARAYGVHSALSSRIAAQRCPDLVFVRPRFAVYKAVSAQIRAVFAEHTALIEPLSLDEAYLDVSATAKTLDDAVAVARAIKAEILRRTHLTATAGVASGKFLAKLASGRDKPDGLTVIRPEEEAEVLRKLPVAEFHGIGPATAGKLTAMGIHTGAQLAAHDREALRARFGKRGPYFQDIARGIDERPVRPDRIRKSVSKETTFDADKDDHDALAAELPALAERVWANLERHGLRGSGVVVKVKYRDHTIRTRQTRLASPVSSAAALAEAAERLLRAKLPLEMPVRLLGVGVRDLSDGEPEASTQRIAPGENLRFEF